MQAADAKKAGKKPCNQSQAQEDDDLSDNFHNRQS
jgi:hypothetical protein